MATNRGPRPPKHLGADGAAFWRLVLREYELNPADFKLLEGACAALDREVEARAQVEQDGAYPLDRFGQVKAHPALQVERQAREQFERFLRALQLDGDDGPTPPPRIPSARSC